MTSRFILPFADVGSGIKPSSGAKLFFFQTNGTTPKDTFSDQLATPTPNSNPVIADANGVFGNIYISGDYKVDLQDKNGSQIFAGEIIEEVITEASLASALINDLSQPYEFPTALGFKNSTAEFPVGKQINLLDNKIIGDSGGSFSIVLTSAVTPNDDDIIQSTAVPTQSIISNHIVDSVVLRIPSDYPDLQTAVDTYQKGTANNYTDVTLFIEAGHQLTGGLSCTRGDFSHFQIASVDPIVTLDPTFVGVDVPENEINGEIPQFPLFYGFVATMFRLNCVIDCNNDIGLVGTGILAVDCRGFISPERGIINAGFRGIQQRGGYFFAGSSNFSGANGTAVRLQKGATGNYGGGKFDGACQTVDQTLAAVYVSRGCTIELRTASMINSGGSGLLVRRSIASADNIDVSSAANSGVEADTVSSVSCVDSIANDIGGIVYYSRGGSTINASSAIITNPAQANFCFRVDAGSRIALNGATQVDAVDVTPANLWTSTPNFNMYYGDGIVTHIEFPASVETGSNADGTWQKFADGRMNTWSGIVNINIGTLAAGAYSPQIQMPTLPQTFVSTDYFQIEVTGKTSVGGGGNDIFITSCHNQSATSNEWKVMNSGVQLDGGGTGLAIETVQCRMHVSGTWK